MNALRLVLAGIGVPVIGAIWWWTARRSSQAPGNAALRESTLGSARTENDERPPYLAHRERSIVALEPLSIHVEEAGSVPVLDEPISPYAEPVTLEAPAPATIEAPAPAPAPTLPSFAATGGAPTASVSATPARKVAAAPALEPGPRRASLARTAGSSADAGPSIAPSVPVSSSASSAAKPSIAPSEANQAGESMAAERPVEQQRIVAIRVCAVNDARWSGRRLIPLLEARGLAFGRYQVFHRKHNDGRSIFCVASLTEPGAFDAQRMHDQDYRGVTLFTVLPGPIEPLQAFDELMATARELARELTGTLQDDRGLPLSPQRAAALREDIVRAAPAPASVPR